MAKSNRTFTWRCWVDGVLRDVVIIPPAKVEKNLKIGGIPGRLYERQGNTLKTTNGVVRQDSDGKVYFVENK